MRLRCPQEPCDRGREIAKVSICVADAKSVRLHQSETKFRVWKYLSFKFWETLDQEFLILKSDEQDSLFAI